MNENPYMKLVKFILPSEMNEYFDLVDVALDQYDDEQRLHLYLDEKDIKPENQPDPRLTASMKSHASMTSLYVNTAPFCIFAVADGRTLMGRTFQRIGSWLPRALATRKSLRLF